MKPATLPRLRTFDAQFGRDLAGMGFTTAQRRELRKLSPGNALRAVMLGASPSTGLPDAAQHARTLALLGTDRAEVHRALRHWHRLLAGALPPEHAALSESVLSSLLPVIDRAWVAVEAGEWKLLRTVLDAADKDQAVRSALESHFATEFPAPGLKPARRLLPREQALLNQVLDLRRAASERERRLADAMSERAIALAELERRRIRRDLHNTPAQTLGVIRLQAEMLTWSLSGHSAESAASLGEILDLTSQTILTLRKLMSDLSAPEALDTDPAAALHRYVERFQHDSGIRVKFRSGSIPGIPTHLSLVIYRVLQECFTNISVHSGAKRINVSLTASDGELRLEVEDDGVGFNTGEGLRQKNCFGLTGMQQRVALVGGRLEIISRTPDRSTKALLPGTKVMVQLPLTGKHPGPVQGQRAAGKRRGG